MSAPLTIGKAATHVNETYPKPPLREPPPEGVSCGTHACTKKIKNRRVAKSEEGVEKKASVLKGVHDAACLERLLARRRLNDALSFPPYTVAVET